MQDLFFLQLTFYLGALWYVLPAYIANASPTILGGGPPIDGGRMWRDGKRLLGDGKTWRGLILGTLSGTLFGVLQMFVEGGPEAVLRALLISFGALLGDLIGSFIKRRRGLQRGQSFLFMDQLGFLIVGTILVLLAFPLTVEGISFEFPLLGDTITYSVVQVLLYLVILLPLTMVVHMVANLIWYALGKQDVPL